MAGLRRDKFTVNPAGATLLIALVMSCSQSIGIKEDLIQRVTLANTKYTLTLAAGAGGYVSPTGNNLVQAQVPFSISATPNVGGYLFSGWTASPAGSAIIGDSGSAATTVTLTGDNVTIQANFTAPTTRNWEALASNSTGKYLAAVTYGEHIYTSANYGQTWTLQRNSLSTTWTSIASDSTGKYLIASEYGGKIYTSSDYGVSWTGRTSGLPSGAGANFQSVASDSTGRYLCTAVSGGTIFTSTNFGAGWTALGTGNSLPASANWYCIVSDSTGAYLTASISGSSGMLYYSGDFGSTWSTMPGVPSGSWVCLAMGKTVTGTSYWHEAAISAGDLYSENVHSAHPWMWNDYTPSSSKFWSSMSSDNTGQYLIVVASNDVIYTNSNYGSASSWVSHSGSSVGLPTTAQWSCATSDGSGYYLAAGVYGGHIYTSQNQGSTWTLSL